MSDKAKVFQDVLDGKIPQRVPINVAVGFEAAAQLAGADLSVVQWKAEQMKEPMEKLCERLYSDINPMMMGTRMPGQYQFLQSQSFVLGSNNTMQHPEVVGMYEEDYDYLIEKPIDCLVERVVPRQFKALANDNPFMVASSMTYAMQSVNEDTAKQGALFAEFGQKYGYFSAPPNTGRSTEAPFDYLADQLRSFSGISADIRRNRSKIPDACEALYELAFRKGLPGVASRYGHIFIPLHMPPFMRAKDMEELWWPSFVKMVEHYAALGFPCRLFCEQDWTRYTDILTELPVNTVLWFEYGDAKLIKDKLGKRFILQGFYPLTAVKSKGKQEVIELAKEYMDILAPGGKYIFGLDKIPLSEKELNMENLCALTEWIRDNTAYSNAGESTGEQFVQSDYKIPEYRKVESKYFPSWESYKADYPLLSEHAKDKYEAALNTVYLYLANLIY